ncbi:MAG TPA: sirohydrochlorin cobaltochelatase [Methylomusa anaerophila]|nr:sirohydrochlorin cobaltochelatase [Methylomusa anaerophila]HML89706.1 sirohydrochlorin cobaltochelatase [Methylomusa anaerophila]
MSSVQAAPQPTKKAILVVSFGTTFPETRKLTIEAVEKKIQQAFPDYEVRRAFTSRIIIKTLAERDGIKVENEKQALDRLQAEGYKEVIVQPLHISPGEEFDMVKEAVQTYQKAKAFDNIVLGRPILYYLGQGDKPDDYMKAFQAVKTQFPQLKNQEAVVLMGHGGVHPGSAAYAALQYKLSQAGVNNVFVYTVEGCPALEDIIGQLKANKIKKVTLMPLMLVAGDHATNDMAGDEKDSAKSILTAAGFKVEAYVHGLGENPGIQEIYVQHVKDAIEQLNQKADKNH